MGEVFCCLLVRLSDNSDTTNIWKDPVIDPITVDPVPHVKVRLNFPPIYLHLLIVTQTGQFCVYWMMMAPMMTVFLHQLDNTNCLSLDAVMNSVPSIPFLMNFRCFLNHSLLTNNWINLLTMWSMIMIASNKWFILGIHMSFFRMVGRILVLCMIPLKMGSTFLPMGASW